MKNDLQTLPARDRTGMSRRRDIRIEAPETVNVQVPTASGPLRLRDLSIRGLCLDAAAPLALKSVHRVTVTLGRVSFVSRAVVVHSHQQPNGRWLMGLEFIGSPPPNQPTTIDDLLDELLAASISLY